MLWKIEVSNTQGKLLFFDKFVGEWDVKQVEPNTISIEYTYSLVYGTAILSPFAWLFAHVFWKTYMKNVMKNILPGYFPSVVMDILFFHH
jgi:hypothetical protein